MATYYWVGGSGTWNASTTTNWAATSGGAGGAGVPNNTDSVIFDANSGTAAVVDVTATAVSLNTTVNKSDINLSLSGSPTLCTSAGSLVLTSGTITLNNNILTIGIFSSSNTNVRFIAFGTGNITLTGNNTTIWNTATATSFTYTGTPTINSIYSGSTGTRTLQAGSTTGGTESNALNFVFNAGTDAITFGNASRVKNLTLTGWAGILTSANMIVYGNYTLSSGTSSSSTGTLTFAATLGVQQITMAGVVLDRSITQNSPGATLQLQDNLTLGSTRTFTLTAGALDLANRVLSTGLFSSSGSTTRSIAFGTGNIILTGNSVTVWTTGTATNLTVTGSRTVNCTYAGAVGTRTIFAATPTSAVAFDFNISAGTDIVATGGVSGIRSLNFTGFSGTFNNDARIIYGSLTLSAGMTLTAGANATNFFATSAVQITSNGKTIDFPLIFDGIGGTFAFQDALTQGSTRAFTIVNGTVQLKNGVTSTVGSFVANSTAVKFLQSTTPGSQATLSQASGTVNVADLNIRDINAVGGASWNAYTDFENTDAGNNDGWNFSLSPPYSTAEFPITLRSFTQPRRF